MSDWVRKITEKLMPANTDQVLVVDQDGLFSYTVVQKAFADAGYTLYTSTNAIDVRRLYELRLHGSTEKSVLVVPFPYEPRPDMRTAVYATRIGYRDIFPYFDGAALKGLSYNALCTLNELKPYETLGFTGTIRFLLENLYHVDLQALDASRTKERFLAALIDVVFHEDGMNPAVKEFLYSEGKARLAPLGKDIISEDALISYLDEALDSIAAGTESACNLLEPLLARSIGHLLSRKLLKPKKIQRSRYETVDSRLQSFFYVDEQEASTLRMESLLKQLGSTAQTIQDVPGEWLDLGPLIGEAYSLALAFPGKEPEEALHESINALNARFQDFIDRCYWQMFSYSGNRRPLTVMRVLEYMRAQPERKKALLVLDGMNVWQWHCISTALVSAGIPLKTNAIFAFLPSITAWSRQALFRGTKPDLSEGNSTEKKHYATYWESKGYARNEIAYLRFDASKPIDFFSIKDATIVGAVCTDLDDLMHGALLGNIQLFSDTQTWLRESGFLTAIKTFIEAGYRCYITSDHGNLEPGFPCIYTYVQGLHDARVARRA